VQALLQWLVTLPLGTLYGVLGFTAALENLVPPFPSDVVVAFGSFLVAHGHQGTRLGVFLVTWFGNVTGAMLVYAAGRRYGAERLERRLAGKHAESRDRRLHALFDRYGMPAVFLSRFVPGVRALVPAYAGAARLPVGRVTTMIAVASAIWYGLITMIAFRVGTDWERLSATVTRYSTVAAIIGTVLLAGGVGAWWLVRRRRS